MCPPSAWVRAYHLMRSAASALPSACPAPTTLSSRRARPSTRNPRRPPPLSDQHASQWRCGRSVGPPRRDAQPLP